MRVMPSTGLANTRGLGHGCACNPLSMECSMKGLEKKKEGKKKAQKTLKEKRAEKHAKKSENA
jgi:hypothetical protein